MKNTPLDDESYTQAEKRLLTAAGSDPFPPSPFFLRRVVSLARSTPSPSPVGLLAWRLLPAMTALTLAICGWGAYETLRLQRATAHVLSSLTGTDHSPSDAVLAAAYLGASGGPNERGDSR